MYSGSSYKFLSRLTITYGLGRNTVSHFQIFPVSRRTKQKTEHFILYEYVLMLSMIIMPNQTCSTVYIDLNLYVR